VVSTWNKMMNENEKHVHGACEMPTYGNLGNKLVSLELSFQWERRRAGQGQTNEIPVNLLAIC
jgi:hypothetical protein